MPFINRSYLYKKPPRLNSEAFNCNHTFPANFLQLYPSCYFKTMFDMQTGAVVAIKKIRLGKAKEVRVACCPVSPLREVMFSSMSIWQIVSSSSSQTHVILAAALSLDAATWLDVYREGTILVNAAVRANESNEIQAIVLYHGTVRQAAAHVVINTL